MLKVIGTGLGRTGTSSLKAALEQLGLGPCYHMEAVFQHMAEHVPLWQAAVDGKPDWPAIYAGYQSAVDWPGVAFMPELAARFSEAKFILSVREAQGWADSFSQAIQKLMSDQVPVPPGWEDWLVMAKAANVRSGIKPEMDKAALVAAFKAHTDRVKATIPPSQLLIFCGQARLGPALRFFGGCHARNAISAPQRPRRVLGRR